MNDAPAGPPAPLDAPPADLAPRDAPPADLAPLRPGGGTWLREDGAADSVQWVLLPAFEPPEPLAVEQAYHAWGSRITAHAVGPHYPEPDPHARLWIGFRPCPAASLIRLGPLEGDRWSHRRAIQGGLLAGPGGQLEFTFTPRGEGVVVTVAVRGLRARMPGWLYMIVQRQLHERATFAFLRQCLRQWAPSVPI